MTIVIDKYYVNLQHFHELPPSVMIEKCKIFFSKPFFRDFRTLSWLWLLLGVTAAVVKQDRCNNFQIFRGVFWHAWNGTSLYALYPAEYNDCNHYGPFFSLIIEPFAVTPLFVGLLMWCVALTLFLYLAIRKSQFSSYQQLFVLWFCAHELLTALFMQQFNIAIAAIILLSYYFTEKEKDFWAALFIMLGTFVKLYGIVGLAFFFFSKHKMKFVGSLVFWAVVMLTAPMVFFGSEYIIGQYQEWYLSLVGKNAENMFSGGTNISLLGMVRKISHCATYSDLWIIIPGMVLFALPYLRLSQYRHTAFRQTLLASVLMFCVLFSTGSESSGYIIALVGVVVWYTAAPWQRTRWDIALMVFVFVLSSLSPSDLFPAYLRKEWVQPYALKALPVTLVWLKLCWEMMTRDFSRREESFYEYPARNHPANTQ